MSDQVLIAVDLAQWDLAGRAMRKCEKFKRPLPSYSDTQASVIEHVQMSIGASLRTDVISRRPGFGPINELNSMRELTGRYRSSLQIA